MTCKGWIPLSMMAHNELSIRKAELAISQLASMEDTIVFLKNPDGTTVRIQPGCTIMYAQSIGKRVEE